MITSPTPSQSSEGGYPDLQDHLSSLEKAGLLRRIDEPVNKDTELHPLVRWQYRGGISDENRKAFFFTNVHDSRGRKFDMPVVVGALAANREIYRTGIGVPLQDIGPHWANAVNNPIKTVSVTEAPCQEVILVDDEIIGDSKGLDALPVPISTPGFDSAPYLTAGLFVTVDPETGVQNMGTYRGGLKASNRMAVRMSAREGGAGGYLHWEKYKALGKRMPCAVVLGCPPAVAYTGPQKIRRDVDELTIAGALAGASIRIVKCKTLDIMVPADSEIIIEGYIDTEYLEPEAPFGESHGHISLEDFNMIFEVSAITRKSNAVLSSIISQVTPSESSVIKRVAYEPMFLAHLRDQLGIKGVKQVFLHEPLTNIRRVIFLQMEPGTPRTEVWRALYGATSLRADCGKYVIAVNEDIDPDNGDAVFWSLGYRADPDKDIEILRHRDAGHGPKGKDGTRPEDSTLLIDATLKSEMPPLALPKREYMERARELWEQLGLPSLTPESPWHGYSLGDWTEEWDQLAERAAQGGYIENGKRSSQRRRAGVRPNTHVRSVPGWDEDST
ncbi:MAG: 3-octaprenyl-4-hydroxybenzoate carboxy-lyase [Alphaproteobacteria bacterium MarineAlpha11_Bin1]|nr:MAG: 3-octaprenyl-4-hydroxybenzoate carboxy-lyase [Alphaproteobacteria bacterium MarineAlpha11_Bin1]|tara:strand:+ start:5902 stop:7572 length:1671 start_codon:yes stop_codon:yes gene_type:complete